MPYLTGVALTEWFTDRDGREYAVAWYPVENLWIASGVAWIVLNDRFGIHETTIKTGSGSK